MQVTRLLFVACFVTTLSAGAWAAKPHVAIIATGGTIAGAQSVPGQQGYQSGSFDIQKLIDAAPQMRFPAVIEAAAERQGNRAVR